MNIDIFGSKVILEILNDIQEKNDYNIDSIYIGTTLESQYSQSISPQDKYYNELIEDDKKIIETDFKKLFRRESGHSANDTLIVDFYSERHSIARLNGSSVTINASVNRYIGDTKTQIISMEQRNNQLENLIQKFNESIKNYRNVILLEIYLCNKYIDEDGIVKRYKNQYSINKVNAYLKTVYDFVKDTNKDITIISLNEILSKSSRAPWDLSEFSKGKLSEQITKTLKSK